MNHKEVLDKKGNKCLSFLGLHQERYGSKRKVRSGRKEQIRPNKSMKDRGKGCR